jgi:hypothetical protein
MAKGPEVGLCTAKDCRRADGFGTIQRELSERCEVTELPCLDVCHGPVVVLDVRSGAPIVVERVRNRAMVIELVDHATDRDELSDRLRKRVLTGSKRAKARRRVSRAL